MQYLLFIMSSSTSAWLLSMISWIIKTSCLCYLPQPWASADNTALGFDNSWYHARPHPIIVYWFLIPLELIQLQWLRIMNKTFLMLITVICMGYPIYLGIALWLPLKEFKTLYHKLFPNILVINRGCSFEVKGVFVRDKVVLQNESKNLIFAFLW